MTAIYDQHLSSDGLTVGQFSLLARVGKLGPIGAIPLASQMGLDRSTMSRSLKPLIHAGWIETIDLPLEMLTDKRSFGLQLSSAGVAKWQSAVPNWRKAQDEIAAQLGEQKLQKLMELIDQANVRLDHIEPSESTL